jgi:hypothetical protein
VIGIFFLMIALGAAVWYTVMASMSLLIGRLIVLFEFSDVSYGLPTWWLLVVTIGVLVLLARRVPNRPPDLP